MNSSHRTGPVEIAPGLRLHVEVEGPADAPVVVFSNSLGSDLGMWDGVVRALGSEFRTVRYDTRGHGRSDAPSGPYSIAELGGDVIALMDALGLAKAAVCGLSLGGMTAIWLAANKPERLTYAVAANTGAFVGPASMWLERAATARAGNLDSLVGPSMERWFSPGFRETNPDVVARGAAMIAGTPPEGYAGCCEAIAAMDQRADLSRIKVPTLVVVGDQDPSTPPAKGEEIQAGIPGSKLVSLPTAHLSAMEAPDDFADLLRTHLRTA